MPTAALSKISCCSSKACRARSSASRVAVMSSTSQTDSACGLSGSRALPLIRCHTTLPSARRNVCSRRCRTPAANSARTCASMRWNSSSLSKNRLVAWPASDPAGRPSISSRRRLQRVKTPLRTTAIPSEAELKIAESSLVLCANASSIERSAVMSSMIHSVPSRGCSGSMALAETRHQNRLPSRRLSRVSALNDSPRESTGPASCPNAEYASGLS